MKKRTLVDIALVMALASAGYKIVKDKQVKEEQGESYERDVKQKQTDIDSAEQKIEEYEENNKGWYEFLVQTFPKFIGPDPLPLQINDSDRKSLSALLSLQLPPETAYKNARNNVCFFRSEIVAEGEPTGTYGSCIFLTADLVLTTYRTFHVEYNPDFLMLKNTVSRADGAEYTVKYPIALSPQYDLTLLRLEERALSVKEMPIGHSSDKDNFTYFSLQEKSKHLFSVEEGTLDFVGRMNQMNIHPRGIYFPPCLFMQVSKPLDAGTNGSPVLQNEKLIGLLIDIGSGDKTTVTDSVYKFIEEIVLHN